MPINLEEDRVYEFEVVAAYGGQQVINNLHYMFRNDDNGNPQNHTMEGVLGSLVTGLWQGNILTQLSDQYQVQDYHLKRVSAVTANPGPPITYQVSYDIAVTIAGGTNDDKGDKSGEAMPSYVAVTVQKKSAILSRSTRGSVRHSGIPESDTLVTEGVNRLSDAAETAWNAIIPQYLSSIVFVPANSGQFDPVIFSRKLGSVLTPPDEDAVTDWTTARLNKFLGTQLSRKRPNRIE